MDRLLTNIKNHISTLQESIEVYVGGDGNVCIAHVNMSEDCFVAIPPEQVDILIGWLNEKRSGAIKYRDSVPVSQ
ncbi:MAG: hypothetical protein ABSG50_07965 [Opitutaceae bacterium]|jgi:hypothetical protein